MPRPPLNVVLDASALLTLVQGGRGADAVRVRLPDAAVSAVSLAEAVWVLCRNGVPAADARAALEPLVPSPVAFSGEQLWQAGDLYQTAHAAGLTPGDYACLTLARHSDRAILTADSAWKRLDLGVRVILI